MSFRVRLAIASAAVFTALLFAILIMSFGFSAVWDAFGSNLVAELIGIFLVVLFIDRLLQKREHERWIPVRKTIVRSVAKVYSSLFNAANHSITPRNPATPEGVTITPETYWESKVFLQQTQHDLERARITIDLYTSALDSFLLPRVSTLIESAEELERKLRFFVEFYNPGRTMCDFISDPPFSEMDKIDEVVGQLRQEYEEVFTDSRVVFPGLLPLADLKAVWRTFAQSQERIWFAPAEYKYTTGRVPFLLDKDTLRRLSVTANIPVGLQVQVFDVYR